MSEVVYLDGEDQEDGLTANSVLEGALSANLGDVLVIGVSEKGYYYATSDTSTGNMLYAVERFKNFLFNHVEG